MTTPETLNQVGVNTQVDLELIDQQGVREPLSVVIVREASADFDRGFLGANTPLAKAILGKFVGKIVPYVMGELCSVRIVSVRSLETRPPTDAAQRRQAILDSALQKAEQTNAEIFAASYTGKWGDYSIHDATKWDEHGANSERSTSGGQDDSRPADRKTA